MGTELMHMDAQLADIFTAHLEAIVKAKTFGHVLHLRGIGDGDSCDNFGTACDEFAAALIDKMFPYDNDECMELRMETIQAYHELWETLHEMTFG